MASAQASAFGGLLRHWRSVRRLSQLNLALELILRQHEPFAAVALDRRWDVLMANAAYARFLEMLLDDRAALAPFAVTRPPRLNALRVLFEPSGLRWCVANWETVARAVLARVHREAAWSQDQAARELLQALLAYPGVPQRWREPEFEVPQAMVIPVELRLGERTVRLFSTITTLGTPQDVTLQELRIESFHAADADGVGRQVGSECRYPGDRIRPTPWT